MDDLAASKDGIHTKSEFMDSVTHVSSDRVDKPSMFDEIEQVSQREAHKPSQHTTTGGDAVMSECAAEEEREMVEETEMASYGLSEAEDSDEAKSLASVELRELARQVDRARQSARRIDMHDKRCYAVSRSIWADPRAADVKWSLLCAACQSYRYDSVLRPFPRAYLHHGLKDIDKLREVVDSVPSFPVLMDHLQSASRPHKLSPDTVSLLHWTLVHAREPRLTYVGVEEHGRVLSLVKSVSGAPPPQHILAVNYSLAHPVEQRFKALCAEYSSQFAYHGSRVDNFYSILHHGLQVSMNKVAAYGPGIYLCSEMSVCLPYSPAGFTWGGSYYGNTLSLVALCEMVNHPDVKYQHKAHNQTYANGSENGPVPNKYYIVQNSDLVRVRYLLVYCTKQKKRSPSTRALGWVERHKLLTAFVAYVALLIAIGLSHSPYIKRYYRHILERLGF